MLETSKFGMETDGSEYWRKCRWKGAMLGSRDSLLEFWDPLILRQLLKLKTSNLAQRWAALCSNEKMKNEVNSRYVGSRDPLLEFCDSLISRERLRLETSNLAQRLTIVCVNNAVTDPFFIMILYPSNTVSLNAAFNAIFTSCRDKQDTSKGRYFVICFSLALSISDVQ